MRPPPVAPPRPSTDNDPPPRWAETRALIRGDLDRLVDHMGRDSFMHRAYYVMLPNFQALLWYRLSRHLYLAGWRMPARLLGLMGLYLTRVEIPPTTALGPEALIAHAVGVVIYGRIGARLTVFGQAGFGGGFGEDDIGGGPGYPVVGDDVVMGMGARAFGAIRIGDGARFAPGAQIRRDVPAGALVMAPAARVIEGGAEGGDNLMQERRA